MTALQFKASNNNTHIVYSARKGKDKHGYFYTIKFAVRFNSTTVSTEKTVKEYNTLLSEIILPINW